jgi:hypothetical protein
MLSDEEIKQIEIHLAEYDTLRQGVFHYAKATVQIAVLYYTILLGITGWLLKEFIKGDISLQRIDELPWRSDVFVLLLLVIPILNAVLMISMAHVVYTTYQIFHYAKTKLAGKLNDLVKTTMLESIDEIGKGTGESIRILSYLAWFFVVLFISSGILVLVGTKLHHFCYVFYVNAFFWISLTVFVGSTLFLVRTLWKRRYHR